MHRILSDARFALRLFARSPGFFATLVGVLIAGVGATTAMFSIVESVLLRPLPYPDPDRLTLIWGTEPMWDPSPASLPDFLDWRAGATTFEQMAATDYDAMSLSSKGATPENLPGANVSGDFFPMLGIHPLHGRFFGPDDDRVGGPRVAVLSASLWHNRFGSNPGIVGQSITLNSEPFTVIGIAPEGFRFSGPSSNHCDVWIPLAVARPHYAEEVTSSRGSHFLHVMGRRKAGVSLERAQAELVTIAQRLQHDYPDTNTKASIRIADLRDALVDSSREAVWVLFSAVGLVFLIVCANVANLLLTRAQSRRAEMAARAALGATRLRLASQMVTETVVVFLIGSVGGAALSFWLVGLVSSGVIDAGAAATIDVRVDGVALAFCVAVCFVCGLVFGLVPAFAASRVEPQAVLKESAAQAGTSRAQHTLRSALVIVQVALAFALLAGSGLALRAFSTAAATPPGFDPENLATARLSLPERKYDDDERIRAFYRDVTARIAASPGVEAVAANSCLPMANSFSNGSFRIEGRPEWPAGEKPFIERSITTPGYFRTMRIPLLEGRDFIDDDRAEGRPVTIISHATAERFFPGEDPIGRRLDLRETEDDEHAVWREIVGVVGDVRRRGLLRKIDPEVYVPLGQQGHRWMAVAIRSPRADAILKELPQIVQSVDPEQAVASRALMKDRVLDTIGPQRYVAVLLGAFAAAALFLATMGIFGLVSYGTSQRTREIGIRMALGSSPASLVGLVMKSGMRLLGLGLALGFFGALWVGRVLAHQVAGVKAFDLVVYAAIPAVLGIAGLLACLVPAWRAVRIPPSIALRYE